MSVFDDLAEKTIISKFNGFASHGALFVNLGYLVRYSSPLTVVLTNADGIPKSYTYDSVSSVWVLTNGRIIWMQELLCRADASVRVDFCVNNSRVYPELTQAIGVYKLGVTYPSGYLRFCWSLGTEVVTA